MFRARLKRGLQDEDSRRRMIDAALADAAAAYKKGQEEAAREAILRLQDLFDQNGIDRTELLAAAANAFREDRYWVHELGEFLTRKSTLTRDELDLLTFCAEACPTELGFWNRLFREKRDDDDVLALMQRREACVRGLWRYFDPAGTGDWPDRATREDARRLFNRSLDDTVMMLLAEDRRDEGAVRILRSALQLDPTRLDILGRLAAIIVERDSTEAGDVALTLEAVLKTTVPLEIRLWAARSLLAIPGQWENGVDMLRQLHEQHPNDHAIVEALISALKEADQLAPQDEEVVTYWLGEHPADLRCLELLADFFAAQQRLDEQALAVYQRACAHGPKRRTYLRLMARSHASREEWSGVIAIFDRLRGEGGDAEDLVIPLATAYSEFERVDAEACDAYQRAIAMGSLSRKVHEVYCRYLYIHQRTQPESVRQFSHTLDNFPDCSWARLGMAAHHLRARDFGRALEHAVAVLAAKPEDGEACSLAARALSLDFSRPQLARLARLDAPVLARVFAEAYRLAPDAGPIAMAHARRLLADGVRTEETVRVLGEVCRRNPDAVDLRIDRADILWELGDAKNAVAIYRELYGRWTGGAGLPRSITPEMRRHVLLRIATHAIQPPGPDEVDLALLMEAAAEPRVDPRIVVAAARLAVTHGVDHPIKWELIQRAAELDPADPLLERAMAEGLAARGEPAMAWRLVLRLLGKPEHEEEVISLMRGLAATTPATGHDPAMVGELRARLAGRGFTTSLLLAAMELLLAGGRRSEAGDLSLLQRLHAAFPRNQRIRHWLAQALSHAGDIQAAERLLSDLVTEAPSNDDAILELARTHARLGAHTRENLRVARAAVALEPDDPDLLLHLAAIEIEIGQPRPAARRLAQLLQDDPSLHPRVLALLDAHRDITLATSHLLVVLATARLRAGRIEETLRALGKLQAHYQHHLPEMLSLYEEVLAAQPENLVARMERAVLFRLCGRVEEAVADLEVAHRVAPDNLDVLREYAGALQQKLNTLGRPDPDLCVRVGEMRLRLGNEDTAYELAEMAVRTDPRNDPALLLMARLQLQEGALSACASTIQKLGNRAGALSLIQQLASAYADQGEHLRAVEVLTDAVEVAGPQRHLLEQLRSLYQEQARTKQSAPLRQEIFGALSDRAKTRYELREEIGSGSMGVVYKAHDRELDEIVVLKILPEHFAANDKAVTRFRNEAKAARKLAHTNIVRIHDFGEEAGRKHISMEYVAGGDLREYLLRHGGRIERERAIQIIRQVASALAHAHAEGILHRDIKAANILLTTSGKAKLSDFGISALMEEVSGIPEGSPMGSQAIIGTPLYMAPEQFRGEPLSPATDLYATGVLFYELLTGKPPFTRGSISYHHQFSQPARPDSIPDGLWAILARLLEKEPRARYQSAEDFIRALDEYLDAERRESMLPPLPPRPLVG